MDEEILNLLRQNHDTLPATILAKELKLSNLEALDERLKPLIEATAVAQSIDKVIYRLSDNGFHVGLLKMHAKGYGFVSDLVDIDHDSYFVPPTAMQGSIRGDEVIYLVYQEDDGRHRAEIKNIIVRHKNSIIGEIKRSYDGRFLDFIPADVSFSNFRIVMINRRNFNLAEGDLYRAEIVEIQDRKLFAKLDYKIGNRQHGTDRILAIAEEFDLPISFPSSLLKAAEELDNHPQEEKEEASRRASRSLVDLDLVTIDGIDSKDLDDAIYVEKNKNSYRLIVAIADVAHYVTAGSPLDKEALRRGNSTYLANTVIPMLPPTLSNKLCSLNPDTEKLVLVCEMEFDANGNRLRKKIYDSVMLSKGRLNYDETNLYFNEKTWTKAPQLAKMLDIGRELAQKLMKKRAAKGMLNLEIREPKIVMNHDGKVTDIKARQQNLAENLIEQFMVSANEAVAETIEELHLPFVYRNHGKPTPEDLAQWYTSLKNLGINFTKLTNKEMTEPQNINRALEMIKEQVPNKIEQEIFNLSLLKHLDKAEYGLVNIGHFGLASKCYTHFTSPIRRYSDLMVHRFLREYLFANQRDQELQERNTKFINKACYIINETEVNSVDCEREVNKVCMIEFMANKVGEVYPGVISAVLKFGFFVQLENLVEGLVHVSTLGGNATYDEKTETLVGANNNFYRLGQSVRVKVEKADIQKRKLDFLVVQ